MRSRADPAAGRRAGPRRGRRGGGARAGRAATRWPRRRWRWPSSTPSCARPGGRSPSCSASPATRIPSGVSVGIHATIDELLAAVAGYIDDGYVRIKLKIEPGWDIEPVRRGAPPDRPGRPAAGRRQRRLHAPGRRAPRPASTSSTCSSIEQPLPEDDLLGHAELAQGHRHAGVPRRVDRRRRPSPPTPSSSGRPRSSTSSPAASAATSTARRIHDLCRRTRRARVVRRDARDRHRPGRQRRPRRPRRVHAARRHLGVASVLGPRHRHRRRSTSSTATSPCPTGPGFGVELDRQWLDEVTASIVDAGSGVTPLHSTPMPHPFLSEEWMAEAKAIRERYAGQTAKVAQR